MREQLQAWLDRLASSVGAPFTRVLRRNSVRQEPSALSFLLSSDAATDSDPPGMGGFCAATFFVASSFSNTTRFDEIF